MIKHTSSVSPLWFSTRPEMYSSTQRVILIRVCRLSFHGGVLSLCGHGPGDVVGHRGRSTKRDGLEPRWNALPGYCSSGEVGMRVPAMESSRKATSST